MPTPRPDLFATLDYRGYLRAWFDWRKSENPRFSHRLFARLARQKSPSLMLHIIEGRRNLTPATREAFIGAMKLTEAEARFFRDLVALDQAETDDDRNTAWESIRATRRFRDAHRIEGAAFDCLSHWTYTAIHELVRTKGFVPDPAWIAKRLRPRATTSEARKALDGLVELGLLVRSDEGQLEQADTTLTTPHEVAGLAVHNYHRGMSALAGASVEAFEPNERHLLGVTVAVPEALMPRLKAELNAMQQRLLDLCDSADATPDRVVQLNLQLFPLSATSETP